MRAFESLTPGTALTPRHRVVGQQVPQGLPLVMEQGQTGKVTQALGDSVSLELDGRLARFEASQLAAFDVSQPIETAAPDEPLEDQVWTVLRSCFDPEIPVNVVDLGLIYDLRLSTLIDGRQHVKIEMTLTAPGCGMGPVLTRDIKAKLEALPAIDQAEVALVFEPPWDPTRMTEEARLETGLF